jgi:hypothetical protein
MPSDIDLLPDIDYLQNVTYGPLNDFEPIIIDTPVLMVQSLHACYSHAVLDYTFLYHWLLSEIRLKYSQFNKFIILFEKEDVYSDKNVSSVIDNVNKTYNLESFNILISLLTDSKPFFEHLLDRRYIFRHLFFYKKNQIKYQRCPWNSITNYSHERPISPSAVAFTDSFIYRKLNEFRNHVFKSLDLLIPDESVNSLIIIERSRNRRFDSTLFQSLVEQASKNKQWVFKGTYCLDEMTFKEQVELFSKSRAFIMRHGSSEINLLWVPQGSVVFEIGGGPEGIVQPNMYKRICKLTDTKHIYLDYNTLLTRARNGYANDFLEG